MQISHRANHCCCVGRGNAVTHTPGCATQQYYDLQAECIPPCSQVADFSFRPHMYKPCLVCNGISEMLPQAAFSCKTSCKVAAM